MGTDRDNGVKRSAPIAGAVAFLGLVFSTLVSAQPGGIDYSPRLEAVVWGGNFTYSATRREDERSRVHLTRLRVDSETILWEPDGSGPDQDTVIWEGQRPISAISLSPSGQWAAFVEHVFDHDVDRSRATYVDRSFDGNGNLRTRYYYENKILRLVTVEGAPVTAIDRVRVYAWSPDGNRLAYITGRYSEDGIGYIGEELWLYDLEKAERTRIDASRGFFDVQWAQHDGRLYGIAPWQVLVWNPLDSQLRETAFRGIYFSVAGTYYSVPGYEGAPSGLFRVEGNRSMAEESKYLASRPQLRPGAWLDDETVVVSRGVYNCSRDTFQRIQGLILGIDPRTGQLIVYRRGSVVRVDRATDF